MIIVHDCQVALHCRFRMASPLYTSLFQLLDVISTGGIWKKVATYSQLLPVSWHKRRQLQWILNLDGALRRPLRQTVAWTREQILQSQARNERKVSLFRYQSVEKSPKWWTLFLEKCQNLGEDRVKRQVLKLWFIFLLLVAWTLQIALTFGPSNSLSVSHLFKSFTILGILWWNN